MEELTAKFTLDDIETLISAIDDWEMIENQDFHTLNVIKNMPMPPEDHESFDIVSKIKDYYRIKEKHILDSRNMREEKSVFLKAKLLMARKNVSIDKLFDMAAASSVSDQKTEAPVVSNKANELAKQLKAAEFFIKDMGEGVWGYYQKFLQEQEK